MAIVKKFEDLEIWKMSRIQVQKINHITRNISFELARQIQRSSASVMDNIAEGFGRGGRKEFKNFLIIAKGSNAEVKSQLYRITDIEEFNKIIVEEILTDNEILSKKISSLIKYLKVSERKGPNY
jgi:four helix bundle protein